jgi:hypothetical protein
MKRSTGDSIKRSRSRPGNALDGTTGAAMAIPIGANVAAIAKVVARLYVMALEADPSHRFSGT